MLLCCGSFFIIYKPASCRNKRSECFFVAAAFLFYSVAKGVDETNVGIIIPIYKAEKMLERCLDSLLSQSYTHWRAILIDDASPDGSGAIAQRYARQDSRFLYLRNECNLGAAAARNRGLELLEDGYAAFLDSDDWWEPDFLEKMLSAAQDNQSDMVQCAWRINYPDGSEIPEPNTFPEYRVFDRPEFAIPLRRMLTGISMNHMARKLVRTELIRGQAFNEALHTAEDLDMSFRMLMRSQRIVFIPDALYHYYRHGEGLTGNGLTFRQKWRDNRSVSSVMMQQLQGTDLGSRRHRVLAWLRPYTIILDKMMRMLRDGRALGRTHAGKGNYEKKSN